ncbi:MAG: hypothetical protein WD179_00330 [Actinomycetota bacterium]
MGVVLAGAVVATLLALPSASAAGPVLDAADQAAALDFEARIVDNLRLVEPFGGGQLFEIEYADPFPHTPGDPVADVHAFADSALWTGTYLGAQSFRYALAKKYINAEPDDDDSFWIGQRDEAKARIDKMVQKFHILVNISGSWQHQFQPSIEQAGFGGGIFAGEPGYLMRACIPTDFPEAERWKNADEPDATGMPAPYTANRRVFGPLAWTNPDNSVTQYYCEDGTSRDAYAGTTFGLLTAFDLVSGDDPAMRMQLRDDIVTLTNFAFKYLWNTPRPHGRIAIPFGTNQNESPCSEINAILRICGHDFENFFSPLFIITPTARLNMAQAASHVTAAAPGRADDIFWQAVYLEELATIGPFAPVSQFLDQSMPYDSYYKHNLDHLIGFNLARNAPNDLAKLFYGQSMSIMDSTTRSHLNAHFETITYALTGDQARLDDAVEHLRQWRAYRAKIDDGEVVNNQQFCGTTIQCVPEDQVDLNLFPGVAPVTLPGSSGTLRSRDPLPIEDRVPTDFLWQRAPNQLNGSQSSTHQGPGVDYLLPYWMIRYYTEGGAAPGFGPFDPWPGPTFR